MPVRVEAHIHTDRAAIGFKKARRELNSELRSALKTAGERVALPAARAGASRFKVGGVSVASALVVRSSARSAYITTRLRGKLARAVGLLEFGGTVHTPIRPKEKRALSIGPDAVATVNTPRTYEPRLFLTTAIKAREGAIETAVRDEILTVFTPEFDIS